MKISTKVVIAVLVFIYLGAIITCVNYVWALSTKNGTIDEKFGAPTRKPCEKHVVALSEPNRRQAFTLADRFPYVVAVTRNATSLWSFACFGSLILSKWIITTAHCRYLATGTSFRSLAFSFRMGKSTVADIVYATCSAIWLELVYVHMPHPTREDLKKIASDYFRLWQFPMCIGSIDGKHCRVKCPAKSGSSYYNYKNYFSIILQGVADANKKFFAIEVGGKGKQSDGGTFHYSTFNRLMENGQLHIPSPDVIPGTAIRVPYVLIADEAYPLKANIMRPFPSRNLDTQSENFNKRLSRARKCIECTFGILYAKWRILSKPIETNPENACLIIKTTCILHNIIRDLEGVVRDDNNYHTSTDSGISSHRDRRNNSSSLAARNIRQQFSDYFWQNRMNL